MEYSWSINKIFNVGYEWNINTLMEDIHGIWISCSEASTNLCMTFGVLQLYLDRPKTV